MSRTPHADFARLIEPHVEALYRAAAPARLLDRVFAGHQYDEALKTLIAYKNSGVKQIAPEATAMIEKLRALGVSEETL